MGPIDWGMVPVQVNLDSMGLSPYNWIPHSCALLLANPLMAQSIIKPTTCSQRSKAGYSEFQANLSFLSQSPGPCLHSLWRPEVCLGCCQLLLFGRLLRYATLHGMKILPYIHITHSRKEISSPPKLGFSIPKMNHKPWKTWRDKFLSSVPIMMCMVPTLRPGHSDFLSLWKYWENPKIPWFTIIFCIKHWLF